jgi:hypothetical protein
MTTDVKVIDKMLVLAPDVRIWSARTRMRPEDYADRDSLPPEELASLGVKKLCPPEKLRVFGMLKSRATSLLSRHGIPFLPGSWLIPADTAAEIQEKLEDIRKEFDTAKEAFLAEYDGICSAWIDRHPGYDAMLRGSMASPDHVRARLSFSWRAFALRVTRQSNLRKEVEGLGNSVFEDIAREARVVMREVFTDRDAVTQKALHPVSALADKLRGLAFLHPRIASAASLVQDCLERMPKKGPIEGTDLGMALAMVTLLSAPGALEEATMRMEEGSRPESLLMPETNSSPPGFIANVGLW